jgi:plasmid rolling circle replication initiator protein Rep
MSIKDDKGYEDSFQDSFTFRWLELWGNRKKRSMIVANAYSQSGNFILERKAERVKECGSWMRFEACKTGADGHTKRLKAGNFCDDRLCSLCNRKRAVQLVSALLLVLEEYLSQYKIIFMTLTVRNVENLDRGVYTRLLKCWEQFQRDFLLGRKYKNRGNEHYYDGVCVGGVVAVETTYNEAEPQGLVWHPHLHGLLVCKDYLNQQAGSEYWHKVTGDSFVVGFSEVKFDHDRGLVGGVVETVKYLAKLNEEMSASRIVELALALRNVRCINGFGVLRGFLKKAKQIRQERGENDPVVCRKCGRSLIQLAVKWYGDKYVLKNLTEAAKMEGLCCNVRVG